MQAISLIEKEIDSYLNGTVEISEGHPFSQYKLVKRIMLFANQIYPTGKTDSQGNYKYYFDIISPRIDAEVKNIDFDTKDIQVYSDRKEDATGVLIVNLALKEYLRDNGQAEDLNESVEESAGWGNVVWKKIKGGYERMDLKNFYVINQTAKTLNDTPVIERHEMTQSALRAKAGVWDNVEQVIENCGNKFFSSTQRGTQNETEILSYEVYERNGEISVAALKELKGEKPADKDDTRYVLAKIVVAGLNKDAKDSKYALFAEEISSMPYREHHRGRYNGRWFRKGLYETLFDVQVRANEIGNQIARGLEWASKTFFRTKDQLIAQNALTDLMNGDILKTEDLAQVEVRMQGFDQLISDWNRIINVANDLANSREIVTGENLPSGTAFRLGALMNQNANKLFDFLREKLAISVKNLFEDWILPDLLRDLKTKDVLRLTGDSKMLDRFRQMAVDAWYIQNLWALPPHGPELEKTIKEQKMQELMEKPELMAKLERKVFEGLKPRVQVTITGEQTRLPAELESLSTFISLEQDPIRRSALIEEAMAKTGMDIAGLPKATPEMMMPRQPAPTQSQPPALGGEKTV